MTAIQIKTTTIGFEIAAGQIVLANLPTVFLRARGIDPSPEKIERAFAKEFKGIDLDALHAKTHAPFNVSARGVDGCPTTVPVHSPFENLSFRNHIADRATQAISALTANR